MTRYDMIKSNLIFEENIFYQKDGKQYIGCLVKSKYADENEKIELILFENKSTRHRVFSLDLIEYEKVDIGWISSRLLKTLFYFQLIPKHQQQKEIFACDTEENRTKWMKILNENIEKFNRNNTYQLNSDDEEDMINNIEKKSKPPIVPRSFNSNEKHKKLSKSTEVINQLNSLLLKSKKLPLNENDIFYPGIFDDLYKILLNINKLGVYAISPKTIPESDCTLAIRVYENAHTPILSWNIYQNKKTNEYFLLENDLTFSNIIDLCLYYTENNLPNQSNTINRLSFPYKHYLD